MCSNYHLTFTINSSSIFIQLLYLLLLCFMYLFNNLLCPSFFVTPDSHFYIFQKESTLVSAAYLSTFSLCCQVKLTGLGVKWKLERASNLRKSVSISFWISAWVGFSSSSVFCWNKKKNTIMAAAQVHICWNNSENKIKPRPDSAWDILAHRFLPDSACSSHGPKLAFSCTQTPPLWVSPCEPHHQMPNRNKS